MNSIATMSSLLKRLYVHLKHVDLLRHKISTVNNCPFTTIFGRMIPRIINYALYYKQSIFISKFKNVCKSIANILYFSDLQYIMTKLFLRY